MNGKIQHTDLIGWCPTCDQYDIFFQVSNANQEIVCAAPGRWHLGTGGILRDDMLQRLVSFRFQDSHDELGA